MGIAFDTDRAAKQEEFVARVSKSYMTEVDDFLHNELIEHSKVRATNLIDLNNQLRLCYAEQDGLIGKII